METGDGWILFTIPERSVSQSYNGALFRVDLGEISKVVEILHDGVLITCSLALLHNLLR